MRESFSLKEMIKDDGDLNHEYFLVKKGSYWSESQENALKRGLHVFGVGKWGKILYYEFSDSFVYLISLKIIKFTE